MSLVIPDRHGSVIRVYGDQSKYPEIWIASNINGGRWYPDAESWACGVRGPLDDGGAHIEDVERRGRAELLVATNAEAYETGWRAACEHLRQVADETAYQCPKESD